MVKANSSKRKTRPTRPLSSDDKPTSVIGGLEVGVRSETGYVREENEDRMSGSSTSFGRLFIVADGMGGYKGGAYAAELTDKTIAEYIKHAKGQQPVSQLLKTALEEANRVVYQNSRSGNPEYNKMGSTAVVALISGNLMHVAHVGDSRAYLHRKGTLRRLTTDHTVGNRMVKMKILTEKQAESHPDAELLDRGIGNNPTVQVEVRKPLQLKPGDGLLLCTDGLSGYASDAEINHALSPSNSEIKKAHSPNYAQLLANRLIGLALRKGGEDNVTVQYIKYLGGQCPRRLFRETVHLIFGISIGVGLLHTYHSFFSTPDNSMPGDACTEQTQAAGQPDERDRSATPTDQQNEQQQKSPADNAGESEANGGKKPDDDKPDDDKPETTLGDNAIEPEG